MKCAKCDLKMEACTFKCKFEYRLYMLLMTLLIIYVNDGILLFLKSCTYP